jgi:hypothetical protein
VGADSPHLGKAAWIEAAKKPALGGLFRAFGGS